MNIGRRHESEMVMISMASMGYSAYGRVWALDSSGNQPGSKDGIVE